MNLASYIEHTVLKPDCIKTDIKKVCEEALQYGFYGVCVPPFFVREAVQYLENSPVKVITVAGFPMGYAATPAKVEEVKRAIDEGADEIDVVVNICAIKNRSWSFVRNDIESVTRAAHLKGKVIKVIMETALLEKTDIQRLCELCSAIDVNFVKTATGFNEVNNTPELVAFIKQHLNKAVKIKVSGGIKTQAQAIALIEAGANRIGASGSLEIVGGK